MTLSNCFQVLDKEGNAVTLKSLDEDACALWNCPYDSKYYASPGEFKENWYDSVGWNIANPLKYYSGWEDVLAAMINIHMKSTVNSDIQSNKVVPLTALTLAKKYKEVLKYLAPYIALINLWKGKGYTPKQIIE